MGESRNLTSMLSSLIECCPEATAEDLLLGEGTSVSSHFTTAECSKGKPIGVNQSSHFMILSDTARYVQEPSLSICHTPI